MDHRRTCLITGANSGIGKATAIELAKSDYRLILFAKDSGKTENAINDIKSQSNNTDIDLITVDLSSRESIQTACDEANRQYPSIDLLINNAGVYKRQEELTADGIEMTLAVNYIAPFMITRLLKNKLDPSPNPKVVNITSALYNRGIIPATFPTEISKYKGNRVYADSKLLVLLDTLKLAADWKAGNIRMIAAHPGVVGTDVFREYPAWFNAILNRFLAKPADSGKTIANLAASPEPVTETGAYYNRDKEETVSRRNEWLEQYKLFEEKVISFLDLDR